MTLWTCYLETRMPKFCLQLLWIQIIPVYLFWVLFWHQGRNPFSLALNQCDVYALAKSYKAFDDGNISADCMHALLSATPPLPVLPPLELPCHRVTERTLTPLWTRVSPQECSTQTAWHSIACETPHTHPHAWPHCWAEAHARWDHPERSGSVSGWPQTWIDHSKVAPWSVSPLLLRLQFAAKNKWNITTHDRVWEGEKQTTLRAAFDIDRKC